MERPAEFSGRELGGSRLPIPRQKLIELPDVVIIDSYEHVGELGLRINVVEPRGLDQRVHHGGTLDAAIGAGEQPCRRSAANFDSE
jgi:hypothetical protein